MTAIQAARAARRLRKELSIEPVMVHGAYGELKVLVDGRVVVEAGPGAFIGIMPSVPTILDAVRRAIADGATAFAPGPRGV